MKTDSLAYPPKWEGHSRPPRRLLAVKMNNFIEETPRIPSGTWPHKGRKKGKRMRPVTATLAKPRLLDITLLGKIDMSLVKKEFLSVYKLMRVPLDARRTLGKEKADDKNRKNKSDIVIEITPIVEKKDVKVLKGNSSFKLCLRNPKNRVDAAFGGPVSQTLPKPCDSCGRESRPERLHAHPQRLAVPEKTLVSRPVSLAERRSPVSKGQEDKDAKGGKERSTSCQDAKKQETSATCAFCGRKFGNVALQSHESKCREKKESNLAKEEKENVRKDKISPRILTPSKGSNREQRKIENEPLHGLRPKNSTNRRTSLNISVLTPTLSPTRIPTEVEDSCAEETPNSEEDIEWTNHLRSLVKCNVCERAFAPDRVLKHQSICDGSSKRPSNQSTRKSSHQKS